MINQDVFITGTVDKIPEELLENRITIEGNLCGLLLRDLLRYDDVGMDITKSEMYTRDGRFLYNLGARLREKGFEKVDEVTLLSNLSEDELNRVQAMGGYRIIEHLMNILDDRNWDAVFDAVLKSNILIRLYRQGFDCLKPFDVPVREVNGSAEYKTPFALFNGRNFTSQEILAYYESSIASCATDVHSDMITGDAYLDFDDNFIKRLQNKEGLGVSFGSAGTDIDGNDIRTFPYLSSDLLGYKHGTLNGIAAASGVGKSTYCITILFSLLNAGEKILVINNEMRIDDYQCMMLVWIANRVFKRSSLTKKKLMSGNFNEDDLALIAQVRKYWKEHYAKQIKIVTLSDANMKLSMQIAKKEIVRNGVTTVLLDTFKLTIDANARENFWMQLVEDCRDFTKLCASKDIIGLMTIQLAIATTGQLFLDASCLSNSKAIKETLSSLVLIRKCYPEELLEGSPYYLAPFWHKKDEATGKWTEATPDNINPIDNYIVVFVDKNRRGIDSGSSGIAYLMKQQLDYAVFKESAKCRPVHKNINAKNV